MIAASSFKGKTVAVMGLARSGLAAARALVAGGARVLAWDDNAIRREEADAIGATVAALTEADFAAIDALVLSPGIPHTHPAPHPVAARAKAAGVPIIGDIEILVRDRAPARLVGVTGTNGKSTTTALIGHILRQAGVATEVGGNIGRSALEFDDLAPDGVQVLELSSYQLELTPSLACDVAVMLNISPDHLDRHGGMDGYIAAKRLILDGLPEGAAAVIGVDDGHSRDLLDAMRGRREVSLIPVSGLTVPAGGIGVESGSIVDDTGTMRRTIAGLAKAAALPGSHNAQNAAAAAAVTLALGVDAGTVAAAIQDFPGLPHRQELVGACGGVAFVNDSKATNADATARALGCYDPIHWIAGGLAKDGGIRSLTPYFSRIRHAYLIGEAAETFSASLHGQVAHTNCGTLDRAIDLAADNAWRDGVADTTVLLSPAAASFDQFDSYEARGDRFREQVQALLTRDCAARRRAS